MKLVVGLGNPGPKYETTRHNIGWLALDRLIDDFKAGPAQDKNQGEVYPCTIAGEKALLIKPMTYMNNSGRCVAPLFNFYKCQPEDLIVIYDELDLKPASIKLKTGGGSGGHNGIKSIDECLGSANNGYHRVRLGVGHPRALGLKMDPADYVLGQFTDTELKDIDVLFDRVSKAVEMIARGDMRDAMTQFNRSSE